MAKSEALSEEVIKQSLLIAMADNPWQSVLRIRKLAGIDGKEHISNFLSKLQREEHITRIENPVSRGHRNRYLYAATSQGYSAIGRAGEKAPPFKAKKPVQQSMIDEVDLTKPDNATGINSIAQLIRETDKLTELMCKLRDDLKTLLEIED